jgi:hypothetical protein
MTATEDDLKTPDEGWIRRLGTDNARWVLVLALEDAESHRTFGSTGSAIVMGDLFDRTSGKLVWRNVGAGRACSVWLAMSSAAIDAAVVTLSRPIEKRRGGSR